MGLPIRSSVRGVMTVFRMIAVPVALLACLGAAAQSRAACEAVGDIEFICDVIGPEDLAIVPGGEWVIASGNQEGGRIQLVHVRDKTATALFPASPRRTRLDAETLSDVPRSDRCVGPRLVPRARTLSPPGRRKRPTHSTSSTMARESRLRCSRSTRSRPRRP